MAKHRPRSQPGSKGASGLEPTQQLAEDSTTGSSWRLKYTENVRTSNSKQSSRKHSEKGNQTGTSAEPHSAD